jgi:hypothetical protein
LVIRERCIIEREERDGSAMAAAGTYAELGIKFSDYTVETINHNTIYSMV